MTHGAVVAVGLTTLDVINRIEGPLVVGSKVVSSRVELVAGGPATNAAVTAAALLGSAELVTALGAGTAADNVDADLAMHSVRVHDCAPVRGWTLPVATCLVTADGERTIASPGAHATFFELTPEAEEAIAGARVILLDGHHPGLAEQALACRRPDSVVILDAGSFKPRAERWLGEVDVLAASSDYAEGLGLTPEGACKHGLSAGCRAVVITQGPGPIVWQLEDGPVREHQVAQVEVRDTLGAGDAFHGALAAELVVALASPDPTGARTWLQALPTAIAGAAHVATTRVSVSGSRRWLRYL